jgi:YD repeat-containing protein
MLMAEVIGESRGLNIPIELLDPLITVEGGYKLIEHCFDHGSSGVDILLIQDNDLNLVRADATADNRYTNCGTSGNSYTPSGLLQATTAYSSNNNGNVIGTKTPNANAGNPGQTNCTVNSVAYSTCASYDNTTQALPASSSTQSLTTSDGYSSGAVSGFGQWPTSTTDPNSQTSNMTYDALGRTSSIIEPGDTAANPTVQMVYANWCSGTAAQTPCVEQDSIQRLNSTTIVTSRSFYDGEGHLVETRVPSANRQDVVQYILYDVMGRSVGQSVKYFVTAYTGAPGAAAYSIPDSTQVGTTTTYDGLGRTLTSTNALSQVTSNAYSVVCGVSGFNDNGCYEQTLTVDANQHQHGVLVDGFGRTTYDQSYTGNSPSTYAVYATTVYRYDAAGNQIQVQLPTTGTETMTYDAAGRMTQQQDPDLGTVTYTYERFYEAVEPLQQDLDTWLTYYNTERPHVGYRNQGKRPMDTVSCYLATVTQEAS